MQFICEAPNRRTWFRIETEAEAAAESEEMRHAVEKYFRREHEAAAKSYKPAVTSYIERDIGLKAHVLRTMPLFLTLREHDGTPLATAMLPPEGKAFDDFRMIIVGLANSDPGAGEAFRTDARPRALLSLRALRRLNADSAPGVPK